MSLSTVAAGEPRSAADWLPEALVGPKTIVATYAVLCALSLLPFLLVAQPPIVDFANHAARLDLACHSGDPAIAAMYRYRLGIIPNLAIDVANLPLCGAVSSATVLKLVTAGSLALIYFSGWLIQRKLFGRPNAFLFLLPAIAFNLVTTMGYINFLAGVAVACLTVALAIGRERQFGTLLIICNLGGLVLFFCHIFALAIGILLFFGLLLADGPLTIRSAVKAGVLTLALFALPLALVLFVPSDGQALSVGYGHKTRMLVAPFMAQHACPGIYGVLLAIPFGMLMRDGEARLHRSFKLPLAILALYVLLVPNRINDAVDIDSRSLIALAYLFFAALDTGPRERGVTVAMAGFSAAFVAFQLWSAVTIWQPFSRQMDELRRAAGVLPPTAKVLTVGDFAGPALIVDPLAYSHVTSYATIERRIFNPLEFTGVGMQPLSVTPDYAAVDTPTGQPYSSELANQFASPDARVRRLSPEWGTRFALDWPRTFDYVIYYHFGRPVNFNPRVLTEIRRGSFFSIFKVERSRPA